MLSSFKSKLPTLLILAGAVLLAYVAVQYATMFYAQKQLARQWQAQQQKVSSISPPPSTLAAGDSLTRLSIPKLRFSAMVVEGSERRQLLLGPGHMRSTAFPGAPGNSVITGHRDTFFRHIVDLDKGDRIVVERGGGSYTYEVAYKKVVRPTDLWVTEATSDTRLTLLTCYPIHYIGPAPERLVVVAKLVSSSGAAPAKVATASAAVHDGSQATAGGSRKQ